MPPGRARRPIYLRGSMRGQHHAGTKNSSGNASVVVGVIVIALLILLAVVLILTLR